MPRSTAAWRGVLASAILALSTLSAGSIRGAAAPPPVFACVQPEATIALSDPDLLDRHSANRVAWTGRDGRCFAVQPDMQWKPIGRAAGLVPMRRTPPAPGMPPPYFPSGSMPMAPRSGQPAPAEPSPAGSLPDLPLFALPALSLPSVSFPAALTTPARPASPVQSPAPTVPPSAAIPVWQRGYALGFALAVLLVTLWVACVVLLVRSLLRRPARIATLYTADAPPLRQPPSPVMQTVRPISRPAVRAAEAARPLVVTSAGWLQEDDVDPAQRCALLLRRAGWHATVCASPGSSRADVVAHRHGRVLALRCLPLAAALDDEAVQDACMARERERADLTAIISEASGTADARKLAAQTGIELLRQAGLCDFAR